MFEDYRVIFRHLDGRQTAGIGPDLGPHHVRYRAIPGGPRQEIPLADLAAVFLVRPKPGPASRLPRGRAVRVRLGEAEVVCGRSAGEIDAGLLVILDGAAGEERVLFVPAHRAAIVEPIRGSTLPPPPVAGGHDASDARALARFALEGDKTEDLAAPEDEPIEGDLEESGINEVPFIDLVLEE